MPFFAALREGFQELTPSFVSSGWSKLVSPEAAVNADNGKEGLSHHSEVPRRSGRLQNRVAMVDDSKLHAGGVVTIAGNFGYCDEKLRPDSLQDAIDRADRKADAALALVKRLGGSRWNHGGLLSGQQEVATLVAC